MCCIVAAGDTAEVAAAAFTDTIAIVEASADIAAGI